MSIKVFYLNILLIFCVPSITLSQHIPTNSKILNITYDKPKGTKIEKERKERKISDLFNRHRYRVSYLGLGMGINQTTESYNSKKWDINSFQFDFQKELTIHWSVSINIGFSNLNLEKEHKTNATQYWNSGLTLQYRLIRLPRPRGFAPSISNNFSPYFLLGGGTLYTNVENMIPKYHVGLGFSFGISRRNYNRYKFNLEYQINYFDIGNQANYLHTFQIRCYKDFFLKPYLGGRWKAKNKFMLFRK